MLSLFHHGTVGATSALIKKLTGSKRRFFDANYFRGLYEIDLGDRTGVRTPNLRRDSPTLCQLELYGLMRVPKHPTEVWAPPLFTGNGTLVHKAGLEPARSEEHWPLAPGRLPIPPLVHIKDCKVEHQSFLV